MENGFEIRVFGLKMDIWSARNAQKNKRKPSVTTVWSIVGPIGPQTGQTVNKKLVFFGPLLYPLVNPRTGSTRLPATGPATGPRPKFLAQRVALHRPARPGRRPGRPFLPCLSKKHSQGPAVRAAGAVPFCQSSREILLGNGQIYRNTYWESYW